MLVTQRFALAIANAHDAGGTADGLRLLFLGARVPTVRLGARIDRARTVLRVWLSLCVPVRGVRE